jgi:NADH:ubiquinone reductase (H+-translocating)
MIDRFDEGFGQEVSRRHSRSGWPETFRRGEHPTGRGNFHMARTRIVVLGGGFGGVYTALHLERALGSSAEITLVSRENFFLFTPMLHEVAASDIDITHLVSPLRALLRHATVFVGEVASIDCHDRTVAVSHGSEAHVHRLPYDHLVVALGSTTNFYGLPGLEQHALTMKTLGDAIHLRNEVIGALEESDSECAAGGDEPLTFVVVGGGFAGVETIAGLNDFVREGLAFYPRVTASRVRMVLVHAGSVILPELGEKLGRYAQEQLAKDGVEIITNARVADAGRDGVRLADGRFIPGRLIVWTAGTTPHPLLHGLPCRLDHGRIVVDETLAVPGFPGMWAVGDCAVVPDRRTGKPHPPTAQHAIREGKTVARNIAAAIKGRPPVPFDFRTIGQLAAIGKRTGVARVAGVNFSGFFAWWLWRTVYLSKLPRLEKKIRVAIDWTLDLVFSKDFVQFLTVRGPVMSTAASATPERAAPMVAAAPAPVTRAEVA